MIACRRGLVPVTLLCLIIVPRSVYADDFSADLSQPDIEILERNGEILIDEDFEELLTARGNCTTAECKDNGCAKSTTIDGTEYERKCEVRYGGGDGGPSSANCRCLWQKKVAPPPDPKD